MVRQLSSRGLWLHLQWAPREDNTIADDLTNSRFEQFSPERRVVTAWPVILESLLDLRRYLDLGAVFFREIEGIKEKRRLHPPPQAPSHKKARKIFNPW